MQQPGQSASNGSQREQNHRRILMGLTTRRAIWYYPPIILLSLTAVGRILAWLLHDAALAMNLIAPEVIVALILLIASRRLATQG